MLVLQCAHSKRNIFNHFVSLWSESYHSDAGPRARENLGGDWLRVTTSPQSHPYSQLDLSRCGGNISMG